MRFVLVLIGGAAGSGARYLVALWVAERAWRGFPWATLAVNVVGSVVIGVLATLADERDTLSANARALLVIGVVGGFTTFSSFSLETLRLVEEWGYPRAALYVLASLVLSLSGVALGVAATRAAT